MNTRDGGLKVFSWLTALVINAGLLVGMAYAGLLGEPPEKPEPLNAVMIQLQELPAKGIERDEKALPRIVKAPEPPPEPTDTASLSRDKKEEELEEKKKEEEEKKRLAEEKRAQEEEEKRLEEERKAREEEERRERRKRMNRAMNNVRDKRADEDSPEGFEDGSQYGTSTDRSALQKDAYVSLVSAVLTRQFQPPAVINRDELKKLKAHVSLKIGGDGKLKGDPRLVRSSGNRFFDDAALSAVKRFGPGTALKIPLPSASQSNLRRTVLRQGITAIMDGGRI